MSSSVGFSLAALVAQRDRVGHAVLDVIIEQLRANLLERRLDGCDLGQDVDAVSILADHALDAAYLPLDSVQATATLETRPATTIA